MAEIRINATGGVKLYDADDSHYAQIVAGTITSNVDAITLGHDTVTIADNLSLGSDSAVLKFGADGDTTLTHTDGTGLTLNSTNKICFNDASQFIQGSSNAVLSLGATDEIDLTATAVDLNGTLNVSGVATFQSTPVFPDGSLALADLDIDGGTDIGAALVDADEIIVDDGGGGTNRRCDMSRVKTYIGAASAMNDLSDVSMDITNFTDSIVIQTDSDGSAPTTGTLSSATGNIGIGKGVFTALTSATHNVVIGYEAGDAITSGEENVFIGKGAGSAITTAGGNIAIGKGAYQYCDDEESNTAVGLNALGGGSLNGGEYNIAIGNFSLDALTSGDQNTAVGYNTGTAVTTGGENTFVGYSAGLAVVGGTTNTLVGRNAGSAITSGTENTCVGDRAGDTIQTGATNQLFGTNVDVDAEDAANQIVIGHNFASPGDNYFAFGKASNVVSNLFSTNASWARSSDERKKRNINDQKLGLDFINDLRTVTFQWKPSNEFPKEWNDYSEENTMDTDVVMHGFIAQEVKEAMDKHGEKDFGGWSENKDGMQNTSREMFVIPLIKAVQELTARVKELEDK
jgi:hypothetical protein